MKERKRRAIAFLSKYRLYTEKEAYINEQMFCNDRIALAVKTQYGEEDLRYVKILKVQKDLALRRTALSGLKEVIVEMVRQLPLPERQILTRYYLDGDVHRAAEDLMEKLEFEKTHIYRLRDRALQRIGAVLETERDDGVLLLLEQESCQETG